MPNSSVKSPALALLHTLHATGQRWLAQPRRMAAAVAALLLVGTGGAYAVASALATLGPDAALLPVQEVTEAVLLPASVTAAAVPELDTLLLYRSDVSRATDTADLLLKRLGVQDPAAAAFMRQDKVVMQHLLGRAGRQLRAQANGRNQLVELSARWTASDNGLFQRLRVTRHGNSFKVNLETDTLLPSTRLASGVIQGSLFAAIDDAGLPDTIGVQLTDVFSGDIDFHRSLHKGDRFSVVYEVLEGDQEPLRVGRVLSAEFVSKGKTYQAMWFQDPASGKGAYYTLDGQSLKRAFLASPMAFSRVSSGFKMRLHPILQTWRAHLGVDYAAPMGTPVFTVGDGVVDFAGQQSGFGNVVFVKHSNNQVTVYAHLSSVAVRQGQRVNQGDKLGAVGASGWATGPHLHFEFRLNGQHQDPMTLARQSESAPLSAAAKPLFAQLAQANKQSLRAAAQLQPGLAQ